MSAVEEIESAIAKLTKLRDDGDYFVMNGWLCEGPDASHHPGGEPTPLTSDPLIVTLHATINAQLLILQDFYERYSDKPLYSADWVPKAPSARNALTLARSINAPS